MGYEDCFAVGAVGGDVAVDEREIVPLAVRHDRGVAGAFAITGLKNRL